MTSFGSSGRARDGLTDGACDNERNEHNNYAEDDDDVENEKDLWEKIVHQSCRNVMT